MNKELQLQMEIGDNLLDIIYHREDFNTGDLQGAVDAQVRITMLKAVEIYKEELKKEL